MTTNLKVEVTTRLDLNIPAGVTVTPELIADLMVAGADGMLAKVHGVSKAAPVETVLGRWHRTGDDGRFTGTVG